MVSSCAEHPTAGDRFLAWHQTHWPLTQKSLAWSAPGVLPFVPCDLITALIDSQSSTAMYSKLQQKAALISFQQLKSVHKVTLSTQR